MNITDLDRRISISLNNLYPNKEVCELNKNNSLYSEVRGQAKLNNLGVEEYLSELGFLYKRKRSSRTENLTFFSLDELKAALIEIFPEKIVTKLSKIKSISPSVDYSIKYYSNQLNIKPYELIEHIGLTFSRYSVDTTYKFHDATTLKLLNDEFDLNVNEIAKVLKTTHQNLRAKINDRKTPTPPIWQKEKFNEEETMYILKLISQREFIYNDEINARYIRIYQNKSDINKIAIFSKFGDKIKCLFDLPQDIYEELVAYNYNKYALKDLEIINILKNTYGTDAIIDTLPLNEASRIRSRATALSMSIKEYINYLDYEYIGGHKQTPDEHIINLIRSYADENGFVKLPARGADYIKCFKYANSRGFVGKGCLQKFIESFGFNYERTRETGDILEKYKEIINRNYIVEENKVYISSIDPFYNCINSYCLKFKGMGLDSFLKELGFEKLSKSELPSSYIPYDWREDLTYKLKESATDEALINLLNDYVIDDENSVYINMKEYIYDKLSKIASIRKCSINILIENLGFKRVYSLDETLNDDEKNTEELIEKLKTIQGSLGTKTELNNKINRNKELVKTLKELYKHKCQLCCDEENSFRIPPIKMKDGVFYTEMHHIRPISEINTEIDDIESMDSYENGIIVCPYHHKVLHYQNGGYFKIINVDENLYFQSELGDLLPIYKNYHLKEVTDSK